MKQKHKHLDKFPDTVLCKDEAELLVRSDLIDDADILQVGTVKALIFLYGKQGCTCASKSTRKFCLWNKFKEREFERFGATQQTFDTHGLVHMDYMQLYQIQHREMHSYSLMLLVNMNLANAKLIMKEHLINFTTTIMKSLLHITDKTLTCGKPDQNYNLLTW